jgi:hypothetical protein
MQLKTGELMVSKKITFGTRGYGETQLLKPMLTTYLYDAEHQINRRSEFIIISID